MEPLFDFSEALRRMKAGVACTRKGWNNPSISVHVQTPDEHSKMTMPYLFMEKKNHAGIAGHTARFPLDLSAESIFAEDWMDAEI